MEQMGNIPPVANVDLFIGIKNGGIGFCGTFEFNHAQGDSIDIKQNVRTAIFALAVVDIIHCKLIDNPEGVVGTISVINEVNDLRRSVSRGELNAVYQLWENANTDIPGFPASCKRENATV